MDVRDGGDDLAVEEVLDRFHGFMKTRYRSVSNIFRRKDELGQKRLDVEAFEGAVAKLSSQRRLPTAQRAHDSYILRCDTVGRRWENRNARTLRRNIQIPYGRFRANAVTAAERSDALASKGIRRGHESGQRKSCVGNKRGSINALAVTL